MNGEWLALGAVGLLAAASAVRRGSRGQDPHSKGSAARRGSRDLASTAVAIVLNSEGKALILRRGSTAPWYPGYWNLPGGMVDEGESPKQAAERELKEETSLSSNSFTKFKTTKHPAEGFVLHAYSAEGCRGKVHLDFENDRHAWVDLKGLDAYSFVPAVRSLLKEALSPKGSPNRDPKFTFWRSCPEMTYETVWWITDHATEITYTTFARNVDLGPMRESNHDAMWNISSPSNWAISFWKSTLPSGKLIYYFDWSAIEHVFVDPDDWPDFDEEHRLAREQS